MLAFVLARYIQIPAFAVTVALPGAQLEWHFDITTVLALFVVGLTASGVDWLLCEHPLMSGQGTAQHWLLPALTAWAVGSLLLRQPSGAVWWGAFVGGSVLLMLVVVAEYIVIDSQDLRWPAASIGLAMVGYTLFLLLVVLVRSRGGRMFVTVPLITLAAALVGLRLLRLRYSWRTVWRAGMVVALVSGEVAMALFYLPLSPLKYALMLVGWLYALVSLAENALSQLGGVRLVFEPALVFVLTWAVSLFAL